MNSDETAAIANIAVAAEFNSHTTVRATEQHYAPGESQRKLNRMKKLNNTFVLTRSISKQLRSFIKEWREGCMLVKDIPNFIKLELNAAATFNPQHPFNPSLKRNLILLTF